MFATTDIIRISSDVTVNRRAVIYLDSQFISKVQFNNARPCWQRVTVADIATEFITRWQEGR